MNTADRIFIVTMLGAAVVACVVACIKAYKSYQKNREYYQKTYGDSTWQEVSTLQQARAVFYFVSVWFFLMFVVLNIAIGIIVEGSVRFMPEIDNLRYIGIMFIVIAPPVAVFVLLLSYGYKSRMKAILKNKKPLQKLVFKNLVRGSLRLF